MATNTNKKHQAKRVNELIVRNEMSSIRFALSIGMNPTELNKLLKGDSGLSEKVASSIADKYGVNINWLLEGVGETWQNIPGNAKKNEETD